MATLKTLRLLSLFGRDKDFGIGGSDSELDGIEVLSLSIFSTAYHQLFHLVRLHF